MSKTTPKTAADLAEHLNPENPRRLPTDRRASLARSLKDLGDLGGIVRNVRTGNLIGGNQRTAIFANDPDAQVVIEHELPRKTKAGTLRHGHVLAVGERFAYREVDWDQKRERLAMVAANAQGGEFDPPMLASVLQDLKEAGMNLGLTGIGAPDIERLLKSLTVPDTNLLLNEEHLGRTNCECPSCGFKWQR